MEIQTYELVSTSFVTCFGIIVAADVEREEFLKIVKPCHDQAAILKVFYKESTYYIGKIASYDVVLVQCTQGSIGGDGSIVVATDLIDRWNPYALVLAGICFGRDKNKQAYGDVLICTQLVLYEIEKLAARDEIYRGPIPEPDQVFLNRARNLQWTWKDQDGIDHKPQFGQFLSGEKLVNRAKSKKKLLEMHPTAIGGEMEGAGLYSAARRRRIPWLMVKSICDWGTKKSDNYHTLAAKNAANFVLSLFEQGGVEKSQFLPEKSRIEEQKASVNAQWELSFQLARETCRRAYDDFISTSRNLSEQLEPFTLNGVPVIPNEKQLHFIRLKNDIDVGVEKWLNSYNDACALVITGHSNFEVFATTFGKEICEIFEKNGYQSKRIHPKENSPYLQLWMIYEKIKNSL